MKMREMLPEIEDRGSHWQTPDAQTPLGMRQPEYVKSPKVSQHAKKQHTHQQHLSMPIVPPLTSMNELNSQRSQIALAQFNSGQISGTFAKPNPNSVCDVSPVRSNRWQNSGLDDIQEGKAVAINSPYLKNYTTKKPIRESVLSNGYHQQQQRYKDSLNTNNRTGKWYQQNDYDRA